VANALSGLSERIKDTNKDANAVYKITDAVAFGDFLTDRPRVQSPGVGIRLVLRHPDPQQSGSARQRAAALAFLKTASRKEWIVAHSALRTLDERSLTPKSALGHTLPLQHVKRILSAGPVGACMVSGYVNRFSVSGQLAVHFSMYRSW
jgi:hypothetical protein